MSESNRLPVLFNEIQTAHREAWAAARMAIDKARDAGKGLAEAKGLLGHGEWLPWLRRLGIEPRTAQRYMKLARMPDEKYDTVSYLGIRGALEAVVEHTSRVPRFPKLLQLFRARETELSKFMDALKKECPSGDLSDVMRDIEQEGGDVEGFIDMVETAREFNLLDRGLLAILQSRIAYVYDDVVWLAFKLDNEKYGVEGWDGPTTTTIGEQCYCSIPWLKKLAPRQQSDLENIERIVRSEPDQTLWRELTADERARVDRELERIGGKRATAATVDLETLGL